MEIFNVTKNIVTVNTANLCGNIACINIEEGLVFVDTGSLVNEAKKFKQTMEKKFDKRTIFLILTHYHTDHIFGMKSFLDVPIIATNACKKIIEKKLDTDYTTEGLKKISEEFLQNMEFFKYMGIKEKEVTEIAKFTDVEIKAPLIGFKDELTLGNEKIIIQYSGGHSLDSATIYLPSEEVLITGDEFYHSQVPLLGGLPESHENWLAAFNNWEDLSVKKVIPGHGAPIDFEYVSNARVFVENALGALFELKEKEVGTEDILKDKRLKDYYGKSNWKDDQWWKNNIKALYERIRDEK